MSIMDTVGAPLTSAQHSPWHPGCLLRMSSAFYLKTSCTHLAFMQGRPGMLRVGTLRSSSPARTDMRECRNTQSAHLLVGIA